MPIEITRGSNSSPVSEAVALLLDPDDRNRRVEEGLIEQALFDGELRAGQRDDDLVLLVLSERGDEGP